MQHLGLEGAFSTSFRNAEGRTALRGGDRGALDSWGEVGAGGVRSGLAQRKQRSRVLSLWGCFAAASGAGGVGELAAAAPAAPLRPFQHYL